MDHEIKWTCPFCNADNVDIYELTSVPLCENCDRDVFWVDVITEGVIIEDQDIENEHTKGRQLREAL